MSSPGRRASQGQLRKTRVHGHGSECLETDQSRLVHREQSARFLHAHVLVGRRTFWLAGAHTLNECKSECAHNNTLKGHPKYVGCSYIRFKPEDKQKCWFSNSLSASATQTSKSASAQQLNVPDDGYGFVNPEARMIRNYIE